MLSTALQARALRLAQLCGARRIYALGVDFAGAGADGVAVLPLEDATSSDINGAVVCALDSFAEIPRLAALLRDGAAGLVLGFSGAGAQELAPELERHQLEHGMLDVEPEGAIATLLASEQRAAEIAAAMVDAPVIGGAPAPAEQAWRVLAIMPAFNEADVIGPAIEALIEEGCDVYLIDHGSTDDTVAVAQPYLGRGLVHIERFPEDSGFPERNLHELVWRDVLRRVEQVAAEHPASWYAFVNADEFRESPWAGVTLSDGLRRVDELGYNAINFALYNFRPVDESFVAGSDVRKTLTAYEPPDLYDVLQIKAWQRPVGDPAQLVPSGGHNIELAERRVFPIPFILRHYPIRSTEHGRRKVHQERLARFSEQERADGWHVQYDDLAEPDANFLHDPSALTVWDGNAVRAGLIAEAMDHVLLAIALRGVDLADGRLDPDALGGWLERHGASAASAPEGSSLLNAMLSGGPVSVSVAPGVQDAAEQLARIAASQATLAGDLIRASALRHARSALERHV